MKATVKMTDCPEPYAVIYTADITDEVRRVLDYMRENANTMIGNANDRKYVLSASDIVKAAVENERTYLYTRNKRYVSGKRLYEIKKMLGDAFVQISKAVIVRLSECESVESDFGGVLVLHLKDGGKEYVSRHYVPAFKKKIGL